MDGGILALLAGVCEHPLDDGRREAEAETEELLEQRSHSGDEARALRPGQIPALPTTGSPRASRALRQYPARSWSSMVGRLSSTVVLYVLLCLPEFVTVGDVGFPLRSCRIPTESGIGFSRNIHGA